MEQSNERERFHMFRKVSVLAVWIAIFHLSSAFPQRTGSRRNCPYIRSQFLSPVRFRQRPVAQQQCVEQYNCGNDDTGVPECIDAKLVCDNNYDCGNGADELYCEFQSKRCKPGEYLCKSKDRCIEAVQLCNNHPDCPDKDDEDECSGACKCTEGKFLCGDGKTCVPAIKVCDNINDCPGNEDENTCSQACKCPATNFLCQDNRTCIPASKFCRGRINDCPAGEDEKFCSTDCYD